MNYVLVCLPRGNKRGSLIPTSSREKEMRLKDTGMPFLSLLGSELVSNSRGRQLIIVSFYCKWKFPRDKVVLTSSYSGCPDGITYGPIAQIGES